MAVIAMKSREIDAALARLHEIPVWLRRHFTWSMFVQRGSAMQLEKEKR